MKHLMNLGKAFLAAGLVLEVGGRVAGKLPVAMAVKGYDLRPIAAGGGVLFGVLTAASFIGGKGLASKLTPAA
jgi:hypothetical protein